MSKATKNQTTSSKADTAADSGYDSIEDARAQAAEYYGFPVGEDIRLTLPDGTVETFTVPFPGMLTDEQQERWDELQFEIEQCDRHPDIVIPDHKLTHRDAVGERVTAKGDHVTTETDCVIEDETFEPGRTIRGELLIPYRKTEPNGEATLLQPPYNARVAIALWGEERYKLFRDNGGQSRLIGLLQTKMQREFEERKSSDPKSRDSDGDLDSVPETDSDGAS
ncbi:hypothetical protein [Mycolicibacterium palauense]|uniref:hypothetical protein n=1 Tax=Mycolicibacterium palauense TaxID=2034511 RepID=UPI001C3F3991|nr:hypothetical protein [Mycolicibacterium palauense]